MSERRPAGGRPRLLYLAQTLPYPPDGGVKIRTYHTLRMLSRRFDVTALCFYRAKGGRVAMPDPASGLGPLADRVRGEIFAIPQEHDRARLLVDHLRSVLGVRVYTVRAYESRDFRRRLGELLESEPFDLVHLESLDLSAYLPALAGRVVTCVHHNIESALLRRRARAERSVLRGAYLRLQARLMAREERRWCGRVAVNVVVSPDDARLLESLVPGARTLVAPNGVDVDAFTPGPPTEERDGVVFVGGTTWFPNRDALDHFADDILPALRGLGVEAPVRWVGRATEEEQRAFAARGIELTGYVDDIRPWVRAAECFVVPLRVGGGTRLKILDAWAMGKAVVSTSVGCEGLDARDGENILVRDEPAAFAAAVAELLRDPARRQRIGAEARRTVEHRYGWEQIGERLVERYLSILPDGGRARVVA